eukprot:CAMPEP_0170087058 /NCGR_PEP_ID=MMETSP0019_2-20121128/21618_1 /TAXON_ID=98059 /ORGANISM="Dinobryon sp., Strain UTEXLB2267" /LENGTH=46 /DNA_ID= /DNA_START= /DNA_END= /DNA_ORIENTATION=
MKVEGNYARENEKLMMIRSTSTMASLTMQEGIIRAKEGAYSAGSRR